MNYQVKESYGMRNSQMSVGSDARTQASPVFSPVEKF